MSHHYSGPDFGFPHQTATLRRMEGKEAAAAGDGGQVIVEGVPVSLAGEARVAEAGGYRFFAGWRSDPFFFDPVGAVNDLQTRQYPGAICGSRGTCASTSAAMESLG
jgi:hypothetical protein